MLRKQGSWAALAVVLCFLAVDRASAQGNVDWWNTFDNDLNGNAYAFCPTGDRLECGCTLQQGGTLVSPDGRFEAVLQYDGNFVLYDSGPGLYAISAFVFFNGEFIRPLFATGTVGWYAGKELANQPDGNLVIYHPWGFPLWASNTVGNGPSTLIMQADGNLVLYRNCDWCPTFATNTVGL